ncbi:MAG: polysaccharide deacetylase family protein [Bryobacterales bacterium]|nr:polysaccharide deacetylase family protein [Bryobacterales bacterium]
MLTRRELAATSALASFAGEEKTVVLTFDDAVKSHRSFVAPLLKELGFGATFFITHRWMDDAQNFLTWNEVAEIHAMGFEIGNHSWTHAGFSTPKAAARLEAELSLVEGELKKVGVPKPVSFAWCGNGFGPEALGELERLGYRWARRGMQPEVAYGQIQAGPAYEPSRHDRLLIPTTGDAYPAWTFEHFKKVLERAGRGRYAVLQFHGVPDAAHPWVHTPPERFEQYMRHLKAAGFRVIALRDLEPVARTVAMDPMRKVRYPEPKDGKLRRPFAEEHPLPVVTGREFRIAPFRGHEHPRIGFLEGAIAPLRGTKAIAFLPWDPDSYVVIDVPEAIFASKKLLFLAHTHIPSIWDERNVVLEDRDWAARGGGLESRWVLPDTLDFGARVMPGAAGAVEMELWVTNKSGDPFTAMRSQVCVMLKRAKGFEQQTVDNKEFGKSTARVRAGRRAIAVEWEHCGRTWGNARCPCLHSDPLLPDCKPGETVRVRGRLWFEQGG